MSFFEVYATSYASPREGDIYSANKKFVLHINPSTQKHNIYDVNDRNKVLWSFSKRIWQEPYFLADDGKSVLTTSWTHVKVEHIDKTVAIYLYTDKGLTNTHMLKDICSYPARTTRGPIGSFWRTWYTSIKLIAKDTIEIKTTGMYHYQFSLKDGSIIQKEFKFWNIMHKPIELMSFFFILFIIIIIKIIKKRKNSFVSGGAK